MKTISHILILSFLFTVLYCHKNEELTSTENVDDAQEITISTIHVIRVNDENGKFVDEFTATVAGICISVLDENITVYEI